MKKMNVQFVILGFVALLLLSQCCTSKDQSKDNKQLNDINNPSSHLPLGMADVSGTVLQLTKENSKVIVLFNVDKVNGYGSSTRPIGVGTELIVEFLKNTDGNNKTAFLDKLKVNTKQRLIIRMMRSGFGNDNSFVWQLINIK